MASKDSIIFIGVSVIIALLISVSTASAFAGMGSNGTSGTNSTMAATSYGANVVVVQHLIEVDQFSNPGYFNVKETIVYKNLGTDNYSGPIYSWIPDGAFNLRIIKIGMSTSIPIATMNEFQVADNVIGWNDTIPAGLYLSPMKTPMYQLLYVVAAEPKGTLTESITFTKKMKYPTLINYNYVPSPDMPYSLIIKLVKSDDLKTTILGDDGRMIQADSVEVGENSKTYNWNQLQFNEITFRLERSNIGGSGITQYLLILLVIIVVVGYPLLRGKSPAIKGFEKKVGSMIPKKQDDDIYWEQEEEYEDDEDGEEYEDDEDGEEYEDDEDGEEYEDDKDGEEYEDDKDGEEYEDDKDGEEYEDDEDGEEVTEKAGSVLDEQDLKAFDLDELKKAKKAVFKVLIELDEDYASGALSENEYSTIRNKYKQKAIEIMKQIKVVGK